MTAVVVELRVHRAEEQVTPVTLPVRRAQKLRHQVRDLQQPRRLEDRPVARQRVRRHPAEEVAVLVQLVEEQRVRIGRPAGAPEHLLVAGRLRREHANASLEELGALADPPMTKDAVAGRIRRLLHMADKRAADLGIPDTESAVTPEMLEGDA